MKKGKIYRNILEVVEDGIYLNIYKEFVKIIDQDINESCSKMMTLYEFLQQLEGINEIYPDLICTTFTIKLVKPNHYAEKGGPYHHEYFDISNEYLGYHGPRPLKSVIEGVKNTIEHLDKKSEESVYYNLQGCNILCITKKSKKNYKRRNVLTKSIRREVFKRDDYKCVECGATKEDTSLHVDHIIPVSQGGFDELNNLQTLCEACNLAKSNRAWKGGQ